MIQFAFQNWNSEYEWWTPNTVPADFIINGEKKLPVTHGTQWFRTEEVFGDLRDKLEAFNYPANKDDFLYGFNGNVRYSHLPTVIGEKYIFPIMIRDTDYFNNHKDIGFDLIHDQVFADVKMGTAKIVLIFPLEGTSASLSFENDYKILNEWCIKHKLTKDQVYYIHGNFKGKELTAGYNFTTMTVNTFVCWVPVLLDQPIEYQPSGKFFLSYNRRPRPHRTLLMCELIKRNLIDKGLISYWGDNLKNSVGRVIKYGRPDLEPQALKLDQLIPLEIDKNLGEFNPAWDLIAEHYQQTFLSIVPETLFDAGTIFFSEKTWKTIAAGHPFILISSPGMLKELRRQGYYTFGSFWDESYDCVQDLNQRIRMALNEVVRISRLPPEELLYMREKIKPILQHNQQLFNQRHLTLCKPHPDKQLYQLVLEIWNSF